MTLAGWRSLREKERGWSSGRYRKLCLARNLVFNNQNHYQTLPWQFRSADELSLCEVPLCSQKVSALRSCYWHQTTICAKGNVRTRLLQRRWRQSNLIIWHSLADQAEICLTQLVRHNAIEFYLWCMRFVDAQLLYRRNIDYFDLPVYNSHQFQAILMTRAGLGVTKFPITSSPI